jgi:hypothetical protein
MDPFNQTIIEPHKGQPIVIVDIVANVIYNHFNIESRDQQKYFSNF